MGESDAKLLQTLLEHYLHHSLTLGMLTLTNKEFTKPIINENAKAVFVLLKK